MQVDGRAELKTATAARVKKVRLFVQCLAVWRLTAGLQVHDLLRAYFTANPTSTIYIGILDMNGDKGTLNAAIDYGKKNGKAIYVFGVDDASDSVLHQNHVPKQMEQRHGLKASNWLAEVLVVLGGKVSHLQFMLCHTGQV
jgi:hypothetical protein